MLLQGYPHLEHLVIDGGLTDVTTAICAIRPPRVAVGTRRWTVCRYEPWLSLATGEIVVCLNADDYFLPGAFASILPSFVSGAEFVVGKVKVLSQDG